ncbi:hypothetical protein [Burkholderia sp. FL-7-2-10-S1-D7]|uniref:hypothetical protein n=1 Tax=Burkholderia sp. FL-7-2-10-S1-D7 TaxID=1637866 RepID=UPI0012E3F34E|nr:hypothetical protein [Burkholderia sp. FL-7-2-10-S1-D7]
MTKISVVKYFAAFEQIDLRIPMLSKQQRNESVKASLDKQLKPILKKYATHSEFLGLNPTDPNQKGALDDTVLHLATRKGAVDDMEALCSGLMNPDTDLGENGRHEEVSDEQATTYVFPGVQTASRLSGARPGL